MNFDKIILTPSERLAQHLRLQAKMPAYAVNYFFEECFSLCNEGLQLLSETRALFLWQSIIAQKSPQLLFNRDTARLAYEADLALTEAHLTRNDLPPFLSENVTTFLIWKKCFDEICQERGYILAAQLPDYLRLHLSARLKNTKLHRYLCAGMTEQGNEIILKGFEVMPKNQAMFWAFLEKQGTKIVYEDSLATTSPPRRRESMDPVDPHFHGDDGLYAFETQEEEIQGVAQYVFEQYQKNPQKKLLIIVPRLFEISETLQSIFYKTFFGVDYLAPHFTQKILAVSGGISLTKTPIVQAIFHVLDLLTAEMIEVEKFCYYLRSPYFHAETTLESRLAFIEELYKVGMKKISDADLILSFSRMKKFMETIDPCDGCCDHLLPIFLSARKIATAWTDNSFEKTLAHITYLLTAISFLSHYDCLPHEKEILKLWQALLEMVSSLDTENHSQHSVIETLKQFASQSLLQEKNIQASIQILRLLEAVGIEADEIIMMNMDADTFPEAAAPNPFLPVSFQIEHNLPHSSEVEETRFAKKLLQRFYKSADKIIFTYAKQRENRPVGASPLLPVTPAKAEVYKALQCTMDSRVMSRNPCTPPFASLKANAEGVVENSQSCEFFRGNDEAVLEPVSDLHGIPLEKNSIAKGGTQILKEMLNCPFQAYGHFRLKAREKNVLSDNYTAKERGNILHRALEFLFTSLLMREVEPITDWQGREVQIIQNSIDRAMHSIPKRLRPALKALEKKRFVKLIEDFLSQDNLRGNFTIHALETKKIYTLGDLQFDLRLDRLERWHSGELVVIDYKTGQIDTKFLDKELEPQLPLYALSDEEIKGFFLVQIHPKGIVMRGMVCSDATDNKNIRYCTPEEWGDFKARWKAL